MGNKKERASPTSLILRGWTCRFKVVQHRALGNETLPQRLTDLLLHLSNTRFTSCSETSACIRLPGGYRSKFPRGPAPRVCFSKSSVGPCICLCNRVSVVTLLVPGPHFENHFIVLFHETCKSNPPHPLSRNSSSHLRGHLQVVSLSTPSRVWLAAPRLYLPLAWPTCNDSL